MIFPINIIQYFLSLIKSKPIETKPKQKSTTFYQIFINVGPLLTCAHVGAMMGFSGIFLPQIEKGDNKISLVDYETASWIASSAVLPLTFSSLLGGYLIEKIGRKWVHCLACIPGIAGWLIITFSDTVAMILFGRVLTGVCGGLTGPATNIYIAETTEPKLRPFILGGIALYLTLGTLISHLLGTFFSWELTAFISTLFPLFALFFTLLAPETPHFLLGKEKTDEGIKIFKKIRGEDMDSIKELDIIVEKTREKLKNKKSFSESFNQFFTSPKIYKPLATIIAYFVCAQFSGINVINFYVISIVESSMGKDYTNSYVVMLSMDVVRVLASCLACLLMKYLKRRTLIIAGGSGVLTCLLILSLSSYVLSVVSISIVSLTSLVALIAYVFFISIALVPLPWCLAGEMLPPDAKGLSSGILCFISFSAFFSVIKTAPSLLIFLGTSSTYLVYSIFCLLGLLIGYFFIPETKNKTLDEISMFFVKDKTEDNVA